MPCLFGRLVLDCYSIIHHYHRPFDYNLCFQRHSFLFYNSIIGYVHWSRYKFENILSIIGSKHIAEEGKKGPTQILTTASPYNFTTIKTVFRILIRKGAVFFFSSNGDVFKFHVNPIYSYLTAWFPKNINILFFPLSTFYFFAIPVDTVATTRHYLAPPHPLTMRPLPPSGTRNLSFKK